jgi:hypothetical protein
MRSLAHARETFVNDLERPATAWQAVAPRDGPFDGRRAVPDLGRTSTRHGRAFARCALRP